MTKNDWQEVNRQVSAEQRETLGDPPTADELVAYTRGELSEREEERIRDLLVAYPDLARMWIAPIPEESQPGISQEDIAAGFRDVQRRLGVASVARRARVRHYIPTTIAAALALVFFGLYVQAENRARNHARGCDLPRVLGAPQELHADANRGPSAPTLLYKDGEAYLLKPMLSNQIRYPHYHLELHDANGPVWKSQSAVIGEDDAFQIVIPHTFLRTGRTYQLTIFGVDGEKRRHVGSYDVAVPSE